MRSPSLRRPRSVDLAHQCPAQGPELEKEFGNGASLFLTRICAYLRTVNMTGGPVGLALQAISVFVGSASGHRCQIFLGFRV